MVCIKILILLGIESRKHSTLKDKNGNSSRMPVFAVNNIN
jgi:hypothetical protein